MVSFSRSFFNLLTIYIINASNDYETYCNYFNEPGYPYSKLYDEFSTDYNYTIEAGTYSLNFCNFDTEQNSINGGLSWQYQCCDNNENLCIYLYEGVTDCSTTNPFITTLTKSDIGTKTSGFNCNANDCTLSYSYYTNIDNNSCTLSPNKYSSIGLVNGGCSKNEDNNGYIGQKCDPSNPSYFELGSFDDPNCLTGNGYNIIRENTCSDDGDFGYNDIKCHGSPYLYSMSTSEPNTINTTDIDVTNGECAYVWFDDIFPIIMGDANNNNYCVKNLFLTESFNFFCSDNELWTNYWEDSMDCSGAPTFRGFANNIFKDRDVTDYNCHGNGRYCQEIIIYRNRYNDTNMDIDECLIEIENDPQEIIPIAGNQCIDNINWFCNDNTNLINMTMYNDDNNNDECNGNILGDIDSLSEYNECIYSPQCKYNNNNNKKPTTSSIEDISSSEQCIFAMIGNTPWVISDDDNKYCVSFYSEYISGYLHCDDNDILYWTIFNSTDCNGYSQQIRAELAFGDDIQYYECKGSNKYCDVVYVNKNEYNSSNPEYPVPTKEECIEITKEEPMNRFPIVVNQCIHGTTFYCDDTTFQLNVSTSIDDECINIKHYGFGFENTEFNVECVYSADCPTSAPTINPEDIQCPFGEYYSEKCIINPCDKTCVIDERYLSLDDDNIADIKCIVDHCGCVAKWYQNNQVIECDDIAYQLNIKYLFIMVITVSFLFL